MKPKLCLRYLAGLVIALAAAYPCRFAAAETRETIEGKIVEVVPAKKEIYVMAEGEKYEYYFKPETELLQGGAPQPFHELKEGMRVRVTALKIGKRRDPVRVEIVE